MTELIKTRKQYIETLDFLKTNRFAYDEANEIDDLIEALRKLATAIQDESQKEIPIVSLPKTMSALAELPDWIKQDG